MISFRRPIGRNDDAGVVAGAARALSHGLGAVSLARTAMNPMIVGVVSELGCAKLACILNSPVRKAQPLRVRLDGAES
jgi:hypothetical protein